MILLFRHGPAGKADPSRWPDDRQRPLTTRGVKRTVQAARGLAQMVPRLNLIVTSPLVRAAETARILAAAFDIREIETHDALAPGGSERRILELLRREDRENVALVGHEPDLGHLGATLVLGSGSLPLKKAGACAIRAGDAIAPGEAELLWLATPSMLRRLARKRVHA